MILLVEDSISYLQTYPRVPQNPIQLFFFFFFQFSILIFSTPSTKYSFRFDLSLPLLKSNVSDHLIIIRKTIMMIIGIPKIMNFPGI